ncbi:prephenate dehydrogenase [Erysipelotrichaceae bacterium Oil+RF-744-GAM-WT-6]|uniref:Prephenate dehydrogenase n=1 Tax=Stecheria intestinalis TaxID=2606630 RepID=A0A7X2NRW5_9FIRM|nr:prephenate dehydrogenase [Stecheria intestinalis]MSS57953.1 prephenate dehydrogenase [Stecheria intestinalis]
MITQNTVITIVGLGLLGGSYAEGLAREGYRVRGIDADPEAVAYARKKEWIEEGSTDPSLVRGSDLVIFALYPHVFVSWIKEHQQELKPGCLITDVTGVKRKVIEAVNRILRKDVEYFACHPMAGREFRGIAYSDANRFRQANFLIVPTKENTESAIETAKQLAEILQFHHIAVLSPEEHDQMIGYLSQLTHVIAVCLMNANDSTHLAQYTGDSFRDLTRIAKINENMWPELFILNKDYLIAEIDAFERELQMFRKMIDEEDTEGMKQKMIQSTERRKCFDR